MLVNNAIEHLTINKRSAGSALIVCIFITSTLSAQDGLEGVRNSNQARRIPDVMYIPTPHDVAAEMLKLAKVSDKDLVFDLGCGDGRILVMAAKKHGCRAVGIDVDPLRVQDARLNVKKHRVEHLVTIKQGDLFNVDLRAATVVMLYLSTKYNTKLIPQLSQMKPGSRVVSHQFGMTRVKPDRIVSMKSHDGHEHTLLLWKVPLTGRP